MNKPSLSYKQAGVDIEQADALVHDIYRIAAHTRRPGGLGNIGSFGALPFLRFQPNIATLSWFQARMESAPSSNWPSK